MQPKEVFGNIFLTELKAKTIYRNQSNKAFKPERVNTIQLLHDKFCLLCIGINTFLYGIFERSQIVFIEFNKPSKRVRGQDQSLCSPGP